MLERSQVCAGAACWRPAGRRLALFEPQGPFQCYAESYVKCFWGLCDLHTSEEQLSPNTDCTKVITQQPTLSSPPSSRAGKEALLMVAVQK